MNEFTGTGYEITVDEGGTERHYLDGRLHRIGAPAVLHGEGGAAYYLNGLLHRKDGPARVRPDGSHEYWLHGEKQDE
jgi:hypothetical protein